MGWVRLGLLPVKLVAWVLFTVLGVLASPVRWVRKPRSEWERRRLKKKVWFHLQGAFVALVFAIIFGGCTYNYLQTETYVEATVLRAERVTYGDNTGTLCSATPKYSSVRTHCYFRSSTAATCTVTFRSVNATDSVWSGGG